MKQLLADIIKEESGFVELRYHKRTTNSLMANKGRVDTANHAIVEGVGVRALVDGAWGFAATARIDRASIKRAIGEAQANARSLASLPGVHRITMRRDALVRQDYIGEGYEELARMPVAEKLAAVVRYESEAAKASTLVQSARCRYSEYLEEKVIATTDGALASLKIVQPEFVLSAVAQKDGERTTGHRGAGVSGGWKCLFGHPTLENVVDGVVQDAVDLLKARYPEGGRKKVILAPAVVGLLCHEAIGHTVEADFVKAGSVAQGKIGHMVSSPLVTMADSGQEKYSGYATGNLPFDDEGVATEETIIIKDGKLNSYLHNRESAAEFGVKPTGNARAWLYNDEPIIRMRNTYIVPGTHKLADMIAAIDDGYLIEGAGSGQADANGEFMFGSSHAWHIKNGKKVELLREATMSGIAFDVLKSVTAVSQEFLWDLGTGHCGKGQPAKVDAGGPYISCEINVGGRQQ